MRAGALLALSTGLFLLAGCHPTVSTAVVKTPASNQSEFRHYTAPPPHSSREILQEWGPTPAWVPFATDGHHVLMVWQLPKNSVRVAPGPIRMAIYQPGMPHWIPIVQAAYPHYGVPERWDIAFPWIIGIWHRQGNIPLDWRLWVGNVTTGAHRVLDHGSAPTSSVVREYPDFSVDGDRVVWNDVLYQNGGNRGRKSSVRHSRLVLFNFRTGRTRVVAQTKSGDLIQQPTLYGDRLVWVRMQMPVSSRVRPASNLWYERLGHGLPINITRNAPGTGVSMAPALWKHYLLFKQGPSPYQTGVIELWDLNVASFPRWTKPNQWSLNMYGESPSWGDGIAIWQTEDLGTYAVMSLAKRTIWTLQKFRWLDNPRHYQYTWSTEEVAGKMVVMQRLPSGQNSDPAYFAWSVNE